MEDEIRPFKEWEALWKEFEALGVPGVKMKFREGNWSVSKLHHAQTWLDEQEQKRVHDTLDVARMSAEASARSARFAMIAAVLSAIAIAVTVIRDFLLH